MRMGVASLSAEQAKLLQAQRMRLADARVEVERVVDRWSLTSVEVAAVLGGVLAGRAYPEADRAHLRLVLGEPEEVR